MGICEYVWNTHKHSNDRDTTKQSTISHISQYPTSPATIPTPTHPIHNPTSPSTCLNPKIDFKTGPASLRTTTPLLPHIAHASKILACLLHHVLLLVFPPSLPHSPFRGLRKYTGDRSKSGALVPGPPVYVCKIDPNLHFPAPIRHSRLYSSGPFLSTPLALHLSLRVSKLHCMKGQKKRQQSTTMGHSLVVILPINNHYDPKLLVDYQYSRTVSAIWTSRLVLLPLRL